MDLRGQRWREMGGGGKPITGMVMWAAFLHIRSVARATHLCVVELILEVLDVEAVFLPGVQDQRLAHLSGRAILLWATNEQP